jgi:DNA processing protein
MNINDIESGETGAGGSASIMSGLARSILPLLDPDAAKGLDLLIDEVEEASTSEIIAALFELELAGLVRQLPGKSYVRVWAD